MKKWGGVWELTLLLVEPLYFKWAGMIDDLFVLFVLLAMILFFYLSFVSGRLCMYVGFLEKIFSSSFLL